MAERYYFSGRLEDGIGQLEGDQAHHAIHVMRFAVGDRITLFDGSGHEYLARVVKSDKKGLQFAVVDVKPPPELPHPEIVVAASLPKGDRQKFMLEKLVELGVDKFIPIHTRRSVAVASANAVQRLTKGVIEATKQCGRRHLMIVEAEQTVENLIVRFPDTSILRLLADPCADSSFEELEVEKFSKVIVAIGPEGGFDDLEVSTLVSAGWQRVRIGKTVLRVETAAIAVAAILAARRDI